MEPPGTERFVVFFGRRIPVGDFRPWTRLLILGAMLTAVSLATKSLARRVSQQQVQDHWEAIALLDERLARRWNPLLAPEGFPNPWIRQGDVLGGIARTLSGRVVDPEGRALENATIQIPNRAASTDETGSFSIPGISPYATIPVRIDPPAERKDLSPLWLDSIPPGLPLSVTSLGNLRLLPLQEGVEIPTMPSSPSGGPFSFRAADSDVRGGFAEWRPAAEPDASGARAEQLWYREIACPDLWCVSKPHRAGENAPLEPLESQSLVCIARGPDKKPIMGAHALLDVMSSGILVRGLPSDAQHPEIEFAAAPSGEHRLLFFASGYLPNCLDVKIPLPAGSRVECELEEAAEAEVTVEEIETQQSAGWALRIEGPQWRAAIVAIPKSGVLRLPCLPAETLRFELLRSSSLLASPRLAGPPWERTGVEVTRTLAPGRGNARVVLHAKNADATRESVVIHGTAIPQSWVYRLDARGDEPTSYTQADNLGRFSIAAPAGERLFAALGDWNRMVPYASGVAEPNARIDRSVWIHAFVDGASGNESPEVILSLAGREVLGHAEYRLRVTGGAPAKFGPLPAEVPFVAFAASRGYEGEITGRTPAKGSEPIRIRLRGRP
jgi:hypothetical protein